MPRIKKQGLDYFPMNTDFVHNRIVRRIMKRHGDSALATLLGAISCIYADEGYYVTADELFYEDLSASLFETSAAQAKSILALAVEYGLFDAALFKQYGILTSLDIQRQYLFSTRRRKASALEQRFCLINDAQAEEDAEEESVTSTTKSVTSTTKSVTCPAESVTSSPKSVTFTPESVTSGTHSIAQHSTEKHSIAQESKEKPLLNSSPETGGTEDANGAFAEEEEVSSSSRPQSHHEWTDEDISRMQSPKDNQNRNFDGLVYNLRQFHIPPQEQYALILKSNFGAIGHPVWKGFYTLRESHGKIRQPGKYLLSLCDKKQQATPQ